jgi:hypothetical protein
VECDCQLLCAAGCAISAADFFSLTTTFFEKYNSAKLCCLLQASLINLYLGLWTTSLLRLERNLFKKAYGLCVEIGFMAKFVLLNTSLMILKTGIPCDQKYASND